MIFLSGLSQGQADGRYVRRFDGATEVAGSGTATDSSGTTQPVLYAPGQLWSGFAPGSLDATLIPNIPSALIRERARIYRDNGVPFLTLARVTGSYLAPAPPTAGLTLGEVGAGSVDQIGGTIQFGAGIRFLSANAWTVADRSSFVRVMGIFPASTSPQSVLDIRSESAGVASVESPQTTLRIRPTSVGQLRNPANTLTRLEWDATGLGFFGTAPIAQPTVTGNRGGNAALQSLLAQLAALGLIIDSTT